MRRSQTKHQRFYHTPEWHALRCAHVAREPRCVRCGDTGSRLQVDHVKPLATHWHLRHAPGNLQTLCLRCHRHKWADDQRGYRTDVGVDGWAADARHPTLT